MRTGIHHRAGAGGADQYVCRQFLSIFLYCTGILTSGALILSTYKKMKTRRDDWRSKAVTAKTSLRYKKKEHRRIKRERDAYKHELRNAKLEIEELKKQKPGLTVSNKTSLVFLALQLFLIARISFRGIARVLSVLAPWLGLNKVPCTQTIINWVTRLTIARMKDTLPAIHPETGIRLFSNGFILIMDASIGLGKGKIMTVLALDSNHYLHNPGVAPSLQHVNCVAVCVADTWTGETLEVLLEKVIEQIGKPLAYLKDGGTDLGKAVRLLGEKNISSLSLDDVSHVVANLLKHEYNKHPLFDVFISTCGKVSKMLKQTILACLAPPKATTKARFMNLHRLVKWASRLLNLSPKGRASKGSLLQKLRDCFDRLPQCKTFINDFLLDVGPLMACQEILKNKGLSKKSVDQCRPIINRIPNAFIREGFMDWLERHLMMANTLGLDQHGMPISSDCIESLFGVAKRHGTGEIKDANRIAMRIPVLCGALTWQDAESVLNISVKEQQEWDGSASSLTKQRREVLEQGGSLEKISRDDAKPNVELIASSKSGQNRPKRNDKTMAYQNNSEP